MGMQKAPPLKPLRTAILRANNGERFDLRYYKVISLRIWVIGGVTFIAIAARFRRAAGGSITGYNESWEIIKTYNAFWTDTRGSRARGHCKINSHATRVFYYRHTSTHTGARTGILRVSSFQDRSNFTPIIQLLYSYTKYYTFSTFWTNNIE